MSKLNGNFTSISKLALGMAVAAAMASAAHADERANYPAGSFAASQAGTTSAPVDSRPVARIGDDSAYPPAVAGGAQSDTPQVVHSPEIFLGA